MTVTLVVEDGSIVPLANSFISLVDARAMALTLGLTLPVDDDEASTNLINGGRYVNSQEPSLQGVRVSIDQLMCEPRASATKYGFDIPSDTVPSEAICAQVEAAAAITAGVNPYPVDDGKEVKLQEVTGAVKREYFESRSTASDIEITAALNCLYPITDAALLGGSDGISFNVVRG
jgi:hypothetical protein